MVLFDQLNDPLKTRRPNHLVAYNDSHNARSEVWPPCVVGRHCLRKPKRHACLCEEGHEVQLGVLLRLASKVATQIAPHHYAERARREKQHARFQIAEEHAEIHGDAGECEEYEV